MSSTWNAWPRDPRSRVPDARGAARAAREIRLCLLDEPLAPLESLDRICEAAGTRVISGDLGAVAGGPQAMLVPEDDDRFCIVLDPVPPGGWGDRTAGSRCVRRHRVRFRIGHELGHVLFYWRGTGRPRRVVPDSVRQERFCDRFAAELLLPCPVAAQCAPSPQEIAWLAAHYDVSMQLAVRAVADAHPGARFGLWHLTPTGPCPQAGRRPPALRLAEPVGGGDQLLAFAA